MLRWVIAFLLIANLAAFAAVSGAFGPLPSAGDLEPGHVGSQVHPEHLDVQLAAAMDTPLPASAVVGAPVSTVAPDAASLPASGTVGSAASTAAPGQAANPASSPSASDPATPSPATPANTPGPAASNAAASSTAASSPAATASAPSAPSSAAQ